MSPKLTEYHIAILGFLAESKYGKRREDKIYEEFTSTILTRQNIKQLLYQLEQSGYIKPIQITEQEIQFLNEMLDRPTSNKGYKITPLGKARIGNSQESPSIVYSNINNSNIAHHSPHVIQSIKISDQPEDIQEKYAELHDAIAKKDRSAIKKAFGYIADKSVDVAIAILTGALVK